MCYCKDCQMVLRDLWLLPRKPCWIGKKRYSDIDKEALAIIIFGSIKFYQYFFILHTDHKWLEHILEHQAKRLQIICKGELSF